MAEPTPDDISVARSSTLLKPLSDDVFGALVKETRVRTGRRGERLFSQGDTATAIFIVLDGWVKLFRTTRGGDEAVIHVYSRGQSFAEAAVFLGGHYPVDCEVVTPARLLSIPARDLLSRMRSNPDIGFAMLASTAAHLHVLVQQVEQLKVQTGAERLAGFLLSGANDRTTVCRIDLPYDKTVLAARLGMKPESLSRAFRKLRDHGVSVEDNHAVIVDVAQLCAYVGIERSVGPSAGLNPESDARAGN